MNNSIFVTGSVLIMLLPVAGNADLFGPSDYDECILDSMKGVTSDVAAAAIIQSCRGEFPKKPKEKPKTTALSREEVSRLTGSAGIEYGNSFGGNIYNGNEKVTISKISLRVTTTSGGAGVSRTYTDDVNISPKTTGSFSFKILKGDRGADYSWHIIDAHGYIVP